MTANLLLTDHATDTYERLDGGHELLAVHVFECEPPARAVVRLAEVHVMQLQNELIRQAVGECQSVELDDPPERLGVLG